MRGIKINCSNCSIHCCGMNPGLTPVLMTSEESYFVSNSVKRETPYREMSLLAKKQNGNCVFLDDKTNRCTIYENRPLECRLFPFLLSFEEGRPGVKLDENNCPNIETLSADKKAVMDYVRKHEFPDNWIKGYESLSGV